MLMNRRTFLFRSAMALGAMGLAGSPNAWGQAKTLQRFSLRLSWIPSATFCGDYVAHKLGFWSKRGLDISLSPGGFEFDSIKLVAGGADTFGITTGPQLLAARANGVPIVGIGVVIPDSPIGWVARTESGIRTPRDFVGRRIGAQFGTLTEITFEALMAKLQIPLTSVHRIPVKFDPKPFVSGDIDVLPVFLIDQPIDLRLEGIKLNEIDPRQYGVTLGPGNIYFTTEKTINDNPEIVKNFIAGAAEGWKTTKHDKDAAIIAMREFAPDISYRSIRDRLERTFEFIGAGSDYNGVLQFNYSTIEQTISTLLHYKQIPRKVNPTDTFTNKFI